MVTRPSDTRIKATQEDVELESRLYEGMFLIDAAKGGANLPEVVQHIVGLLERHGAKLERIERWAENKLAYSIKQVERGIYLLMYFQGDPTRIDELRHDVQLSEEILRLLVLRAEQMSEPRGQLLTPEGEPAPMPKPEMESEAAVPASDGSVS